MHSQRAYVNAVAGAVPGHDIHQAYIGWAAARFADPRERALFIRMAERAGIDHRWSVLPQTERGGSPVDEGGFYAGPPPGTAERMRLYADAAPALALEAIAKLKEQTDLEGITHLVVASCTGFVAPGVDQIIAAALELENAERTLIGFMGCYAAAAVLRTAHHIVRSDPAARVLAVTVELSSLHLQSAEELEPLLAELQFGDGAAAALVTAEPQGLGIVAPFTASLPQSDQLIRWTIGDAGFEMVLSGEVPGRIGAALQDCEGAQPPAGRLACRRCRRSGQSTPAAARSSMRSSAVWTRARQARSLTPRARRILEHVLLDPDVRAP
jgi:predicted naringenin-chalcone synthase